MKWFSLVYQGDVHTASNKKVLPAKVYSSLLTAEELIEKAKEDAATLLKNTEIECEKLKEKAKEEGKVEGLQKFNEQIFFLDQELKKVRHSMQQQILPLALKAAKKIVSKELELFPDTIVDIVMQTLAPITQSRKVVIYVNKDDKEKLEAQRPKIKEILPHVELLSIQEREDISPGGCIIQTEGGMINATIENQWSAIERAFDKYYPSNP